MAVCYNGFQAKLTVDMFILLVVCMWASNCVWVSAFTSDHVRNGNISDHKHGPDVREGDTDHDNDHDNELLIASDEGEVFADLDSNTYDWYHLVNDLENVDLDEVEGHVLDAYDPVTDSLVHETDNPDIQVTRKHAVYRSDLTSTGQLMDKNVFRSASSHTSSLTGNASYNIRDGIVCPEKCLCDGTKLDCAGQNLTAVPRPISPLTTWLDLSMNSLHTLPDDTFVQMASLKELRCVGNYLTDLPHRLFRHNKILQLLNFQGNFFTQVPAHAFQNLSHLVELHLDANLITHIPKHAFTGLTNLKQLWLDDNKLSNIPLLALRELTGLQAVTFIKNQIVDVPDLAFQNNTKLVQLRLADNQIRHVSEQAFCGLGKLKYLQLQKNRISKMPAAFSHLVSLDELNLEGNRLTEIPEGSFQMKEKLTTLILGNNPIAAVSDEAFVNMPSLQELKLSEVLDMTKFPDLSGTTNLTVLQLDRANIKSIPRDVCSYLKKLKTFDVHSNKIGTIPEMSQCKSLIILNMANNELTSIDGQLFQGMDHLKDLTLSINYIHTIPENAFTGLGALEYLNLAENHITEIHSLAFLPLQSLKDLNLGYNRIHQLPTAGLVSLEKLKVFHNPDLREFPPKHEFPNVNSFVLSYAYHCCDFVLSRPENTRPDLGRSVLYLNFAIYNNNTCQWKYVTSISDLKLISSVIHTLKQIYLDMIREHVVWMEAGEPGQMAMWARYENESKIWESLIENTTIENELWESFARSDYDLSNSRLGPAAATYLEDYHSQAYDHNYVIAKAAISCKPRPGPFMPCDDLFGWWSLRCGVWFVFMLALLGNGVVFCVSVTSKSKMDVPRFLICNLALADFFMGIYLGILAIMDASTLGQFKKYAIQWQMSTGCLIAGTLGVLSSELSVFTLTVITLERFYAITHAMQVSKRLSLKHAGFIMLCGWVWSFGLAILPLFGISDYRKFAVCLPFEIESVVSKSYVCFIMVFNGTSFFIILSCYMIMYFSIRDSQAWNSSDTRVAKRMALLVFTDFLCWAPIAFLSLAAAFGKNLIHLNEAKVVTIFILPLNSCANPFLYAFFTKQFKKDCVLLCRRLEDSSIAKHFSQVSQRHVSMSWKYQRRPSALHSLMGDNKSINGQNNSSSSNSYGLINYNSDISSRDVAAENNGLTHKLVAHAARNNSSCPGLAGTCHRHTHNYVPCPVAATGDDDDERGCFSAADEDVHVILHKNFDCHDGMEPNGCTAETDLSEYDHLFIIPPQPLCGELTTGCGTCGRRGSLHCPSIVIHIDDSCLIDEDCIWVRRSPDSDLQDTQQQEEINIYGDMQFPASTTDHVEQRKDIFHNRQENMTNTDKDNRKNCALKQCTVVDCSVSRTQTLMDVSVTAAHVVSQNDQDAGNKLVLVTEGRTNQKYLPTNICANQTNESLQRS